MTYVNILLACAEYYFPLWRVTPFSNLVHFTRLLEMGNLSRAFTCLSHALHSLGKLSKSFLPAIRPLDMVALSQALTYLYTTYGKVNYSFQQL